MLIVLRPHPGGGIGNYLFQLCHSITYAQIREATLVVPRPIAFRTMNEEAIAFDFSSDRRSFDPNEIEVLPSFIHGNSATQLLSFAYRYHCMQEYVKPLFDPSAGHESLGDDTLAIHIRSGDIFQPDGSNPKYGQPPLSWYQLLIEKSGYEDIVLVTQTRFVNGGPNPVVAEIQRRWPHVRVLSEGIEPDFHTLRHAAHLALSGGTFAVAAAMLNTRLSRLHVPLYDREPDPNFTDIFPAGCDLGFERIGYEIGGYDDMRVWRNRPEQVALMLEHSLESIRTVRE
ncbi:hypothetical protein N9H10_05435 [Luminiphilus sp.]|nr:hypothetical protein [Luminiphilus sp.]MDA8986490.1 hypothetical protein [Luminiphilus sp.]MDB2642933.1 hypothetical protein [Luminiphilus sp.]